NQRPGEAAVRSEQTSASLQNGVLPPAGVPGALTNQPPGNPTAEIQVAPANPQQDPAAPNAAANAAPNAAANNAAGGAQGNAPAALGTAATAPQNTGTSRNDATINYEVDRTISHVKDQLGSLRRLSVAVVVNYRNNADGEATPIPEAE